MCAGGRVRSQHTHCGILCDVLGERVVVQQAGRKSLHEGRLRLPIGERAGAAGDGVGG
jgi:hypothetical protein